MTDEIVKHYIFLRSDLPGYNCGMLAAQVSHLSFSVLHKFYNHPDTISYLNDIEPMHTIVFKMKGEQLEYLKKSFEEMGLEYCIWYEKPEEFTCISPRPIRLKDFTNFKKLKSKFSLFTCMSQ